MSDPTKPNEPVIPATETPPPAVVEASPVEESAREQGWVSREEWVESGRDESEWRPAKEFVERGELYRSIHQTKRELKQTQAALSALQRHHQFVFEKAHAKALQELKQAKREAIRNEDMEALAQIEDRIEQTQTDFQEQRAAQAKAAQAAAAAAQPASGPPEFQMWQSRNPWYATDGELREFADATGMIYANKNPGVDPITVLKHVEKTVRARFPEKFGTQKTAAPNPTASVDRQRTRGPSKADDQELDDMERQVMQTLVKSGVMTEAEYKAELKKVKGA